MPREVPLVTCTSFVLPSLGGRNFMRWASIPEVSEVEDVSDDAPRWLGGAELRTD